MVHLKTSAAGLSFQPPLILASGIMGQTASSLKKMVEMGMGGVVTKSIGVKPREGHPNPSVIEMKTGLLNAMGLPNPGIHEFAEELEKFKSDKPLIGSVYASDSRDFLYLSEKMEDYGVDAVELNLSCPHAKGYGASVGYDAKLVRDIVEKVVEGVDVPVFPKLPPMSEIASIATVVEEAGAHGIVAVNTVKSMAINYETSRPVLGNLYGGYSGPGIKPIALRCVYDIFKSVNIPVIGCGGITSGRDALEFIMAGSSVLEIGSSVYYRGLNAAEKITSEMKTLLEQEGYASLEQIIGNAHG
ncbi:MAG: dihydroorotate dehydrogenase [Thermoplasmata archaeon]